MDHQEGHSFNALGEYSYTVCKAAAATHLSYERKPFVWRVETHSFAQAHWPSSDGTVEIVRSPAAGALFRPPPEGSLAHVAAKDEQQTEAEWEKHRALFRNVDRDRSVLAWVNAEEHLRLAVEFKGCDVCETFHAYATVYETLRRAVCKMGEEYALDEAFGWVGCNPAQIGTSFEGALRIRLDSTEGEARTLDQG